VKLENSATESFRLLTNVYGDDVMPRPRVFERHKQYGWSLNAKESIYRRSKNGKLFKIVNKKFL